jgi:hypothetical protein
MYMNINMNLYSDSDYGLSYKEIKLREKMKNMQYKVKSWKEESNIMESCKELQLIYKREFDAYIRLFGKKDVKIEDQSKDLILHATNYAKLHIKKAFIRATSSRLFKTREEMIYHVVDKAA